MEFTDAEFARAGGWPYQGLLVALLGTVLWTLGLLGPVVGLVEGARAGPGPDPFAPLLFLAIGAPLTVVGMSVRKRSLATARTQSPY